MKRAGVRGGIVSLTQTEIMLVLAVVILLLLLAKNAELGRVCNSLPGNPCAEILGHTKNAPETDAEPPAPETEVTETLVPGGGNDPLKPLGTEPSPEDADEADETDAEKSETSENADEADAKKSETSAAADESQNAAKENVGNTTAAADEKNALPSSPTSAAENGGVASANAAGKNAAAENARRLREDIVRLQKENAALRARAKVAAGDSAARNLRREIGCLPCWLGSGAPRYYFAFNITYTKNLFRISPHRDLQSGAPPVQEALAGALGAIYDYPRGAVGREEFLRFAEKITAAKKRMYGENGCRLPATINEEATGRTIKFVRDAAGFCPILR